MVAAFFVKFGVVKCVTYQIHLNVNFAILVSIKLEISAKGVLVSILYIVGLMACVELVVTVLKDSLALRLKGGAKDVI